MGVCYFHSIYWNHRGRILDKPKRHDVIIRSEELGMMLDDELQTTINGTTGIFYYEFDLENKEELKKRLHELVDEIGEEE